MAIYRLLQLMWVWQHGFIWPKFHTVFQLLITRTSVQSSTYAYPWNRSFIKLYQVIHSWNFLFYSVSVMGVGEQKFNELIPECISLAVWKPLVYELINTKMYAKGQDTISLYLIKTALVNTTQKLLLFFSHFLF